MLSAGMLTLLALSMIVLSLGLPSGSPPPMRAATVISLIMLVKILPRLASSAPFLCLILCHFECPDIYLVHLWGMNGFWLQALQYITVISHRLTGIRRIRKTTEPLTLFELVSSYPSKSVFICG